MRKFEEMFTPKVIQLHGEIQVPVRDYSQWVGAFEKAGFSTYFLKDTQFDYQPVSILRITAYNKESKEEVIARAKKEHEGNMALLASAVKAYGTGDLDLTRYQRDFEDYLKKFSEGGVK